MRMRTIEQAAGYLQEQDSDTAITKTALRRLVTTGRSSNTALRLHDETTKNTTIPMV